MANNELILVDGMFCDEHVFDDGGIVTKLSFNVRKFTEFLNTHANEKGYVNIDVTKSQKSGKPYGKLNQWKPRNDGNQQSNQNQEAQSRYNPNDNGFNNQSVQASQNSTASNDKSDKYDESSIPF